MSIFKNNVIEAENGLIKEKKVNFWKKLLSLGFVNNDANVQEAERNLESCRKDLAESVALRAEVKNIIGIEESISFQGIRVSKFTFADIRVSGAEGYPAEWQQLRLTILQRDNFTCLEMDGYCSGPLQIHHILELSKGGSNHQDNLITLCRYHHTLKHPHMQREY